MSARAMDRQDPKASKRHRGGRERLLSAAADLVSTQGLSETSLQMIADRLGVTKPALYHHFRSRDDIIQALMDPVIADAGEALQRFRELPPARRPAAARAFYAEFAVRHRRIIHMVFFDRAAMPGDLPSTVDALADGVAAALAGSENPAAQAGGSVLVYGIAAYVARHPELDDDDLRRHVDALFATLSTDTDTGPGGPDRSGPPDAGAAPAHH